MSGTLNYFAKKKTIINVLEQMDNFSNVVFLSHFDYQYGNRFIVDEIGHIVTVEGGHELISGAGITGTAALYNQQPDKLGVRSLSKDYMVGTEDFEITFKAKSNQKTYSFNRLWPGKSVCRAAVSVGGKWSIITDLHGLSEGNIEVDVDKYQEIMLTRINGILYLLVDGKLSISIPYANTMLGNSLFISGTVTINQGIYNTMMGYLNELRFVIGKSRTSNEYLPTNVRQLAPTYTDVFARSCVFATNFEGTEGSKNIIDLSNHRVTIEGNAYITEDHYDLGDSSLALDGISDALVVDNNGDFSFGSGDFEIHIRFRPIIVGNNLGGYLLSSSDGTTGWSVVVTQNSIIFGNTTNSYTFNYGAIDPEVYHDLVINRTKNKLRFIVNNYSVQTVVLTGTEDFSSLTPLYVGCPYDPISVPNSYFGGNISRLVINKGISKNFGNKYPDILPYSRIIAPNTDHCSDKIKFLLHLNGQENGTTFTEVKGKVVTKHGQVITKVGPFMDNLFLGGSAMYVAGAGMLSLPADGSWDLNSNFTIECRFICNNVAGTMELISAGFGFQVYVYAGGIYLALSSSNNSSYFLNLLIGTIESGRAYHLSINRYENDYYVTLNGRVTNTALNVPDVINTGGNNLYIGGFFNNNLMFNGYINEFAFTQQARYLYDFYIPRLAYNP